MSYTLIKKSTPIAKKEYKCIWCSEKILKGESHIKEVGEYCGDFQSNRWHVECYNAATLYFQESGEDSFEAGDNERGSKEEKQQSVISINNVSNDVLTHPRIPIIFELTDAENNSYYGWIDLHRTRCRGNSFNVLFTETGIGKNIIMICGSCGMKKDITDYNSW